MEAKEVGQGLRRNMDLSSGTRRALSVSPLMISEKRFGSNLEDFRHEQCLDTPLFKLYTIYKLAMYLTYT